MTDQGASVGVIVIGRNEGERLKRCLRSLVGRAEVLVYVDSGSTDGSQAFARSLGVEVVDLDMDRPFTMARGRNAGLDYLLGRYGELDYVQFVDGDCEVVEGWIELARRTLDDRPEAVAVCGHRREQHPEDSIYNRLADQEWQGPVGEVNACGGDVMVRTDAVRKIGGYRESLIAGEDPEFCVRLRQQTGGTILRLDALMTRHDAAMMRFGQWWRRTVRGGHAFAEGTAMHGGRPERHKVRELQRALFWGAALPMAAVAGVLAAGFAHPVWLAVPGVIAAGYGVQVVRIYRGRRREGTPVRDAWLYAGFCLLGKVPEAIGAMKYALNRLRGRRSGLIEYKAAGQGG
ncbi:MAG: glycosyltransferase family 2 protein [Phycisphaeraceae bacterium]